MKTMTAFLGAVGVILWITAENARAQGMARESAVANSYVAYVVRASDREYQRVDRLVVRAKDHAVQSRTPTGMGCDRVHIHGSRLLCFTRVTPDKPRYYTEPTIYLHDLKSASISKPLFKVKGIVSRARMSADGRFGTGTAFTTGHSYLGIGGSSFSTMAFIVPLDRSGESENLQNWTITYQGKGVTSVDLNLWGVTFDPRDSNHFLVTVYFNGRPYLGEGYVSKKEIKVLQDGIECPSYSPDGTRIAYKSRTGPTRWSPSTMDLVSGKISVYADVEGSVDDQIGWLDKNTVVFQMSQAPLVGSARIDLYMLDLREGSPRIRLWLEDAKSPALVEN